MDLPTTGFLMPPNTDSPSLNYQYGSCFSHPLLDLLVPVLVGEAGSRDDDAVPVLHGSARRLLHPQQLVLQLACNLLLSLEDDERYLGRGREGGREGERREGGREREREGSHQLEQQRYIVTMAANTLWCQLRDSTHLEVPIRADEYC